MITKFDMLLANAIDSITEFSKHAMASADRGSETAQRIGGAYHLLNGMPQDKDSDGMHHSRLNSTDISMLKTAVHQTFIAWTAQKESIGCPQSMIDQQVKSWRELADKLESL